MHEQKYSHIAKCINYRKVTMTTRIEAAIHQDIAEQVRIYVGIIVPNVKLYQLDKSNVPVETDTHTLLAGRKVVLVTFPGAESPTCSAVHAPAFIEKAEEFKKTGTKIVFASGGSFDTNRAWLQKLQEPLTLKYSYQDLKDNYSIISDPIGTFALKLGVAMYSPRLGITFKRGAFVLEDLKIKEMHIEENPKSTESCNAYKLLSAVENF